MSTELLHTLSGYLRYLLFFSWIVYLVFCETQERRQTGERSEKRFSGRLFCMMTIGPLLHWNEFINLKNLYKSESLLPV